MLPLPQQYKVKGQRGFIYNLLKREGDVALSEQFDVELNKPIAYETFVVQRYPDRMSPDGKTFIPAKEAPPRSELWGSHGFSCTTLESAEKRMQQLIDQFAKVEVEGVNIDKEVAMMQQQAIKEDKSKSNETRSTKSSKRGDKGSETKASGPKKGVKASGQAVSKKGAKNV